MLGLAEEARKAGAKEKRLSELVHRSFANFLSDGVSAYGWDLSPEEKYALWNAFQDGFDQL
jgi:hypothetical protein